MARTALRIQCGDFTRRSLGIITAVVLAGPLALGPLEPAPLAGAIGTFHRFSRPQVLTSDIAQLTVRVRGGATCSGTPLTGGTLVVTAAHCVLDGDGEVGAGRTVVRDGITYEAAWVLVNPDYHTSPSPRLDAAVLVMTDPIPGPAVAVADEIPTTGLVTIAGFQELDRDGSLLRDTRHDNRPHRSAAGGRIVEVRSAVAGCVGPLSHLERGEVQVVVPCGLLPGASGGGALVGRDGTVLLVGIVSSVAHDLTYNGLVPLSSLRELLENADLYAYRMAAEHSNPSTTTILRS